MPEAIGLVLLLPFLGFLINALFGNRLSKAASAWVACGAVGLAFVAAVVMALTPNWPNGAALTYDWTLSGSWKISFGLLADPLSAWMCLIITGVGFLIHVYSIGYMSHEPDFRRYFAYLNLFVTAMLLLVTSDNFVGLLIGWANVGLASFLLIGFYTERPSAVAAARKAIVINTIGDVGLILGIFTIITNTGSLTYREALTSGNIASGDWRNWAALFLFIACAAKSAQIPLQTWLPDAMEGPTPVSALIHAATMVTAGVYLVVRAHTIFGASEWAAWFIPIIGALTAFYAATCALAQTDLKRVLAYSTISQLGYMFMAAGVGAYEASMFHLLTHAFFKALLFLSAGLVIHALAGEQDMRNMGGLRREGATRFAAISFIIGALAISGIPIFSGFFSKEAILGSFPLLGGDYVLNASQQAAGVPVWFLALIGWVGVVTAFITAFYMFRAYFLTFEGKTRFEGHPHANPQSMTVPVGVLAVLTTVGGFLAFEGGWNTLETWFAPIKDEVAQNGPNVWRSIETNRFDVVGLVIGVGAGVAGIALAYIIYMARPVRVKSTATALATMADSPKPVLVENPKMYAAKATQSRRAAEIGYIDRERSNPGPGVNAFLRSGLNTFLLYGWGFDLLYNLLIVWPGKGTASLVAHWFDRGVEQAVDSGLGGSTAGASKAARRTETGFVRNYALGILLGAVAILIYVAVIGLQR